MSYSKVNQYLETKKWRKRDNKGNVVNSLTKKTHFFPFKVKVPAGGSFFTIPIPKKYLDRIFSFDNVMLINYLYSDQAQAFDEETEEELKEILNIPVCFKVFFLLEKKLKFYGDVYEMPATIKQTVELIQQLIAHFELLKPSGIYITPLFFDWIDTRFKDITNKDEDTYYQRMAPVYYGKVFDANKHYNALPHSARNIRMANNDLIPTLMTDDLLLHFKLRMNIAPNSVANFSTDLHLMSMGFNAAQYGTRVKNNKSFKIKNERFENYKTIEANEEFMVELIPTTNKLKVSADILEQSFVSENYVLQITKKNFVKNEEIEIQLKDTLSNFEKTSNISFGVSYLAPVKKFKFFFPKNNKIGHMTVVLSIDFAERLGFEFNTEITPANALGEALIITDPKETENRARALSHETGLIIASNCNESGMETVGIQEKFMAALYPTETGNMVMHVNEICNQSPTLTLPTFNYTEDQIPLTFLLSRLTDRNQTVKLVWKDGITMQGTLRGLYLLT
jgi:hypothetical protein